MASSKTGQKVSSPTKLFSSSAPCFLCIHADPLHKSTLPPGSTNGPYLPPPDVARQIPCRYFPNCSYANNCIFYHPTPEPPANSANLPSITSPGSSPRVSSAGSAGNDAGNSATAAAVIGNPAQGGYGNSSATPTSFDGTAFMQMGQQMYYYPTPTTAEEYEAMQAHAAANMNGEYMQFSPSVAGYAAQHQQYYGYPPQAMQSYGGPPPHNGMASDTHYQHFSVPYYSQTPQGMYTNIPPSSYPTLQPYQQQPSPQSHEKLDTSVINDPAIISRTPHQPSFAPAAYTSNGATTPLATATSPELPKFTSSSNATISDIAYTTSNNLSDTLVQQPINESNNSPSSQQTQAIPSHVHSPAVPTPETITAGSSIATSTSPTQHSTSITPLQPAQAQFLPYYPMVMPIPEFQQNHYSYSSHSEAARAQAEAQAQLDMDFATASVNGHQRTSTSPGILQSFQSIEPYSTTAGQQQTPAPFRRDRGSSLHMHTYFQTGDANGTGGSAASTYDPPASSGNVNATSSLPSSLSQSTNNRADRADGHARGRSDLAISMSSGAGHVKRSSFGGPSSSRGPFNGVSRPARAFDPSRPIPPCTFFGNGQCRNGDTCHFAHLLEKERAIPGQEGKMTRDAKALKLNIGNPNGDISTRPQRIARIDYGDSRGSRSYSHPRYATNASVGPSYAEIDGADSREDSQRSAAKGNVGTNMREKFDK